MKFMKPKNLYEFTIKLPIETIHVLDQYAKYCNETTDNVADFMLLQLLEDKEFLEFIKKKKDNKKMLEIIDYNRH